MKGQKTAAIALAQVQISPGDIEFNLQQHLNAAQKAAEQGVRYLVFPELSLTGYLPERAAELAFEVEDARLTRLTQFAAANNMTVVAGAPINRASELPELAALIFKPDGTTQIYSKIHLHGLEKQYFSPGSSHIIESLDGLMIGNAICADISHAEHSANYASNGAGVYLAGVLISESGYAQDETYLVQSSKEHNMLVGIANYMNPINGWIAKGDSALWFKGELLCRAGNEASLVIARKLDQSWETEVIIIA